jgi:hypothetical protein
MKKTFLVLQVLSIFLLSCGSNNNSNGTAVGDSTNNQPVIADSNSIIADTSTAVADTNSTVVQPAAQKGPDVNARLALRTLWCNAKTDVSSDEDEIYLLVAGKKSDGTEYTNRLPTGLTWSLTKGGGPAKQAMEAKYGPIPNGFDLWSGSLKDGESIVINVLFMDEDNSQAPARAALLSDLVKRIDPNDPKVLLVAGIASAVSRILGANQDDFVGAYAVKITNNNGNKKVDYVPLEQAILVGNNLNGKRIDVAGSGGHYFTTIAVY